MKQIEVAKRQICKEFLQLLTTTLILIGQRFARNEDSSTPNVNVLKNAAKLNKYSIICYISNVILYLCSKIEKMKLNRIKTVLVEKDLSQKWLAEQLGKSFSTINAYCCNRQQPNLDTLYKIAKLLSVELKVLIVDKTIEENIE